MKGFLYSKKDSPPENLYAAQSDFCKIFTEDMSGLHLLALLLTADSALAEQCFVAGFEDSIQSNTVFKQWAHSWSRRAIIKNAIRMVGPSPSAARNVAGPQYSKPEGILSASLEAVSQLEPFDRFVLVMSVLESYTSQDCATLLNCTRQDVIAARSFALQQLANATANGASVSQATSTSEEKSRTWMPQTLIAAPQHL